MSETLALVSALVLPLLAGVLLGMFFFGGLWLDRRHPGARSWTLMLLVAGLCIGCANAWHWVAQQDKAMHDEPEDEKAEDKKNE